MCREYISYYIMSKYVLFFFFFQAEDGIRDYKVTGVQTCALPIFQALNMLNSPFVLTRIHQNNQGSHVAAVLAQTADPGIIIWDLFATTLSRPPSDTEMALFGRIFQQQGNRVAAENLQWVLLNKADFLFNY